MEIDKIVALIENFAPLELQESWDNSGWQIDYGNRSIDKILLALTVTEDIVNQAIKNNCDLIISHHPLFFIPFDFNKDIPIYSAHTNLDAADGGTTDTLITLLGFLDIQKNGEFLRVVDLEKEMPLDSFVSIVKNKLSLKTIRVVNNFNQKTVKKLAFCAGSGIDFLSEAEKVKADIFITGDLKYHSAMDSKIILADVGHFESEYPVLNTIKQLFEKFNVEVMVADEKSPFINY